MSAQNAQGCLMWLFGCHSIMSDWQYCEEAVSKCRTCTMLYLHCKMFRSPCNKWLAEAICYVAQNIFLECTIFIPHIYIIIGGPHKDVKLQFW